MQDLRHEFRHTMKAAFTLEPPPGPARPPYGTIGMAIDYRLRYYFPITPSEELAAFHALPDLLMGVDTGTGLLVANEAWEEATRWPNYAQQIPCLGYDFFTRLQDVVILNRPAGRRIESAQEENVCRYCYVLALLEELMRPRGAQNSPLYGLDSGTTVDDLLDLADHRWITDLCQMSYVFYERHPTLLQQRAILNPVLGRSDLALAADADIIVGECLIDFKATKKPLFDPQWLYQILGYAFLDFEDFYGITEVGLYLARQGVLLRWQLDYILPLLAGSSLSLSDAREDFRKVIARG